MVLPGLFDFFARWVGFPNHRSAIEPTSATRLSGFARAEATQAADQRCGAADCEPNKISFIIARVNHHAGLNRGKHRAFVLRNAQLGFDDGIGVERSVNGREQSRECLRR